MASGKQVSFAYGEVSPDLKYKTDSISFAMGLSKLRNMIVDAQGGVYNRPGFRTIGQPSFLSSKSFRMFSVSNPGVSPGRLTNQTALLLYLQEPSAATQAFNYYNNRDVSGTPYRPSVGDITVRAGQEGQNAQVTDFGQYHILTFGKAVSDSINTLGAFGNRDDGFVYQDLQSKGTVQATKGTTSTATGLAPLDIPVSYLYTVVMNDGEERAIRAGHFTGGHPHADAQSAITVTISAISPDENMFEDGKQINIYRSSSKRGIYSFIGSHQIPEKAASVVIEFMDFGNAGDPSRTPPVNGRLWGLAPSTSWANIDLPMPQASIKKYRRMVVYQQRLLLIYDGEESDFFPEGTMGASAIGAPTMLWMPDIYNASGAFEFRIPIPRGDKLLFALPMERLVVFSKTQVQVVQGGENGILTPTTINPKVILEGGCSETIAPKMVGDRGYFVDNAHTKIYQIVFTRDGNLIINTISDFSNHLVKGEELVRMEVTSTESDVVWMLNASGKLTSITIKDEFYGFAVHETEGEILDICVAKYPASYRPKGKKEDIDELLFTPEIVYPTPWRDQLIAIIKRPNGTFVEYMDERNDIQEQGYNYLDNSSWFGTRLVLDESKLFYLKLESFFGAITSARQRYPLIPTQSTGWEAGQSIELIDFTEDYSTEEFDKFVMNDRIFFYYEREGEVRTLRATVTGVVTNLGVDTITVFSDEDWPVELRDLDGAVPADALKATRYVKAVNKIRGVVDRFVIDPVNEIYQQVSVYADGLVISNTLDPQNNLGLEPVWDSGLGEYVVNLPEYVGYGVVGLSYTSEMWTQDLDTTDNRTFTDKGKLINSMGIALGQTRGGYYGSSSSKGDIEKMESLRDREDLDFDNTTKNINDHIEMSIPSDWNKKGRVGVKQIDPLPLTVLSIYPKGIIGG